MRPEPRQPSPQRSTAVVLAIDTRIDTRLRGLGRGCSNEQSARADVWERLAQRVHRAVQAVRPDQQVDYEALEDGEPCTQKPPARARIQQHLNSNRAVVAGGASGSRATAGGSEASLGTWAGSVRARQTGVGGREAEEQGTPLVLFECLFLCVRHGTVALSVGLCCTRHACYIPRRGSIWNAC